MKRALVVGLWVCLGAVEGVAQLGKTVTIAAGTPEDRALLTIEQETDPAKRVELLEKFVQEFAGDARLLGYRRLQASYLSAGELDKAIGSGLQALKLDASDFSTLANLTRAFAQKQDAAQAFSYGLLAVGLVQRLKGMAPPEGTGADVWENFKANLLEQAQPDYQFLEYTLYQLASQQTDPATQGALFERYIDAFADSGYLPAAYQVCFGAYQRAGDADKVLEVGEGALAKNPDNLLVILLVADGLSELGKHLERAEALAQRIPELADKAARPETQSEEQWAQQKNTWKGVALSIQGQILLHREKTLEATAKFREAEPLLAPQSGVALARNLYREGYAYAKLGRLDPARRALMQAVAIESPYKAVAQELLNKVNEARAKRLY